MPLTVTFTFLVAGVPPTGRKVMVTTTVSFLTFFSAFFALFEGDIES